MKKILITLIGFLFMNTYHHLLYADNSHHHTVKDLSASSSKLENTPTIQLEVQKIIDKKDKKLVFVKLTDIKSNKPITFNDLTEIHTKKFHLLIIDNHLIDYSHVHPEETATPGIYQFEWQPNFKNATYRAWADLLPTNTNKQEYATADLTSPQTVTRTMNPIHHRTVLESTVNGYQFKLTFNKMPLLAGKPAMGEIDVTDSKGHPVRTLEPIMGAYAHIVGFNEDFKTVIHVHPMGKEPANSTERGGPQLQFHIEPNKAGFIKMFAQVQIDGKVLYAPFAFTVKNA
ncbi:hypothetical protein [Legionella pneumophila]|uniref:hypothetical protein n=1 Tax=Legionella pneumophila TaxID=446 RepID=UPI000770A5A8|nr:hypothetical protein [Legionella pneumophila]CZF99763.1 Uncharacterised protein [Legionella pneumophila]